MVKERVTTQYICEFCQKEYVDLNGAEKCEKICRRFADSPSIEILNLSPRSFNVLYYSDIKTVGELIQLSEKELLMINGLGRGSLREINARLIQFGANLKVVQDRMKCPPRTDAVLKTDSIDSSNSPENRSNTEYLSDYYFC